MTTTSRTLFAATALWGALALSLLSTGCDEFGQTGCNIVEECSYEGERGCSNGVRYECVENSDGCLEKEESLCKFGCEGSYCSFAGDDDDPYSEDDDPTPGGPPGKTGCNDNSHWAYDGEKWCSGDLR